MQLRFNGIPEDKEPEECVMAEEEYKMFKECAVKMQYPKLVGLIEMARSRIEEQSLFICNGLLEI